MRKKKNKNPKKVKGSFWKGQPKNKGWDTVSFEDRESQREIKKKERVNTKNFTQKQSFGGASEVVYIDKDEFLKMHPEYGVKNETR